MSNTSSESLSATISKIYDCALHPEQWTDTLTHITTCLDAAFTTITLVDSLTLTAAPKLGASSPWDTQMMQIATQKYAVQGVPGVGTMFDGVLDVPRSTLSKITEKEFQATPFFQDWAGPQGLRDGCVLKFVETSTTVGTLSLVTSNQREPVSNAELQFVALLSPHLRRAALISDLLNFERLNAETFKQSINHLSLAVMIVDQHGKVMHANPRATLLIDSQEHIHAKDGIVTPVYQSVQKPFEQAISDTAAGCARLGAQGIGIPLPSMTGKPAIAYVLRIGGTGGIGGITGRGNMAGVSSLGDGSASAAIFISTSTFGDLPRAQWVETLYGLTAAESKIVLLAGKGTSGADVARELGVSENTVKTHLSHIYIKTGINRQVDLVRLMSALAAPTPLFNSLLN